jgi:molecular chaperone GrpE (heat shock protein)
MSNEFSVLRHRIIESLRQNHQLSQSFTELEKAYDVAHDHFVNELIEQIDFIEAEERTELHRHRQDANRIKVIEQLYSKIKSPIWAVLQRYQVTRIDHHLTALPEATKTIQSVERADLPEGSVVAVLRAGYLQGGKVLRPAEVVTNRHGQEA